MNPNQPLKKLRIFAASPSDVANERAKIETVVSLLKPLADHIGLSVEVVDWRKVVPDMGRPQQVIFDQLQPTTWDVFIGILWHRFGTPPGGKDPQTQKEYLSGTEEEFRTAFRLWEQFKKPLLDNLQKLLLEYSEKEKGRPVSAQEMQMLAPQSPDNLPRRAAFFGRDKEMERVLHALSPEERGWGVVIDGIGGIGKTALAVEAAYRCKERGLFEAFIFVSAKQKRLEPSGIKEQSPVAATLDEFVNETARVLGQIGIAKLTDEDKRRALLEALRSKRALLIYDNLETLTKEEQEALADFLRFLPQGCKAILTSRRRGGEGALWLRLEQLTWETARQIIQHEAAREARLAETLHRAGETRWRELFNETGGSPLALIWTLGLMRKKALSFERALEMLRHGASDLLKFIYEEARKELGTSDIAALNALSFFVSYASFEALMATADLTRTALETVLERLSALALVDILPGEERYNLHPLTCVYVRNDLLTDVEVEQVTGMRFASYWVDYAWRYGGHGKDAYKKHRRLEEEWANLEAAANRLWTTAAVKDEALGTKETAQMMNKLAEALGGFLWFSGRWDERVRLSARAYLAVRAITDWTNAGWRAYDVAFIHYNRACTDDAVQWTNKCAEAWKFGGGKREQAFATRMQGLITWQRNDYDEAERLLQKALAIDQELGMNEDVTAVLMDLGDIARERKEYDNAERYYRQASEQELKTVHKMEHAICNGNLGELALDCKKWAEAGKCFENALHAARELTFVGLMAKAQAGLARVYEAEGRLDLALSLAHEALAIYERLQDRHVTDAQELVQRLTVAVQKKVE